MSNSTCSHALIVVYVRVAERYLDGMDITLHQTEDNFSFMTFAIAKENQFAHVDL